MLFFFFNDTATTEIYTLSLHDALPIFTRCARYPSPFRSPVLACSVASRCRRSDRKSTRLNSSHSQISYAVFCLKKKKLDRDEAGHRGHRLAHQHYPCKWRGCELARQSY